MAPTEDLHLRDVAEKVPATLQALRPGWIRPPNGPAFGGTFAHQGVRLVTRTVRVGSVWSGSSDTETAASTTERYDVGGCLRQVTHTAKNSGGSNTTQTRSFTYDGAERVSQVLLLAKVRDQRILAAGKRGLAPRLSTCVGYPKRPWHLFAMWLTY